MNNKREHLVPMPVRDMRDKILNSKTHINEKTNIADRLDAIMEYCEQTLKDANFFRKK